MASPWVLAGDIGGTNGRMTACQLAHDETDSPSVIVTRFDKIYNMTGKSPTEGAYKTLSDVLSQFFRDLQTHLQQEQVEGPSPQPLEFSSAVIAVCGPVFKEGLECTPCNLWQPSGERWAGLNARDVEASVPFLPTNSLVFLNDFEAIGQAIAAHTREEAKRKATVESLHVTTIWASSNTGDEARLSPAACLGAGTGLGACYITPNGDGSGSSVWSSEHGMAKYFSPRNQLEMDLLQWMLNSYGEDSVWLERVLSGPGLVDMYTFLVERDGKNSTASGSSAAAVDNLEETSVGERGRKVHEMASHQPPDPTAVKAVAMWLTVYGRCLSDAALTWLCYRGLFIAGGIAPQLLIAGTEGNTGLDPAQAASNRATLLKGYFDCNVMSSTVEKVPLYLLSGDNPGQLGALDAAVQRLCNLGTE